MKNNIFLFVLLSVLLTSCSNIKDNLTITGSIKSLKKGTLYLQKVEDTAVVSIDSLIIDGDSRFSFSTFVESPQIYYLHLDVKTGNIMDDMLAIFVEPGEITVQTTLKNFERDAVITGSKNHVKLSEYREGMQRYSDKNLELLKENFEAQKLQNDSILKAVQKQQQSLLLNKYLATINFAKNNSSLEVAPYLVLTDAYNVNVKFMDTVYNSLSASVKTSKYGKELERFIAEIKSEEE